MELRARTVALYGRFEPGLRSALAREIEARSGRVVRDLIHRADILVVGSRADSLIDSGALLSRLATAYQKRKRVFSAKAFQRALDPMADGPALTFPLENALRSTSSNEDEARLLAAFDLITLDKDKCAFGDVAVLRTAANLRDSGLSSSLIVRTLRDSRDTSPKGRHRIIVTEQGVPALRWDDAITGLDGQHMLPFEEGDETIDDLFERAVMAEVRGDLEEAARLFEMCARADRSDAVSLYNAGNIRLRIQDWAAAALTYQRALARDPGLIEARYNLSHALEELGRIREAIEACQEVLAADRKHADATFNLAQLYVRQGQLFHARNLFERYLALGPPADWARKAHVARTYCDKCLSIGDPNIRMQA